MKLISAFWLVCRKVLLGMRHPEYFFLMEIRNGLWKYVSWDLPAARSSKPITKSWKSTFGDNLQISHVHSFLKYSHSKMNILMFVFLPRFENVRERFGFFFSWKLLQLLLREEKNLTIFSENKGRKKTAVAENWNVTAHWRLDSQRHLTTVTQHLS